MNKKIHDFINENIIKRKAMFIPILGVSLFMLVGYAAVDKDAPEIVSNRIEVPYGEKLDLGTLNIVDNHDDKSELLIDIKTGNVNVNQLGEYEVTISATDCSANVATKKVLIEVVDDEAPKFDVIGTDKGYVVQVPIYGSNDVSNYIKAIDNVDGDVSPFIETDKLLDTSNPGIQDIVLSISDSSGNVSKKMFEFAVSDLTPPSVELTQGKDIVIDYASEFKLENYLITSDDMGSVTNTVSGSIDTKKENTVQTIKVSTKDEANNEVITTLNFTVKDISGPTIILSTNNVEVAKGEAFDPRAYLVSAIDNKDGDVLANVTISDIDTNSTGNKVVEYRAVDSLGNESLTVLNVKVYTPGTKILETAYTKLGSPYKWGATGPSSFDCSGFTSWVYRQHGIYLSRTAQSQSQGGVAVDRSDLQPGDLVFFGSGTGRITHVGIYVGNGMMVHSPQTGDVVKVSPLNKNYVCARRYL